MISNEIASIAALITFLIKIKIHFLFSASLLGYELIMIRIK